jgi:nucleoid-associated protein YgaU
MRFVFALRAKQNPGSKCYRGFLYEDYFFFQKILPTVTATAATAVSAAAAVATAAATVSTAAAIATAAAATATTAAAAEAATASAAAAAPAFTGFSFFNNNRPAVHFGIVQFFDGVVRLVVVGHFHKGKAFGTACKFVHDNIGRRNFAKFFKSRTDVVLVRVVVQFCYEDVHCKKN